jgi:hypothetical protein
MQSRASEPVLSEADLLTKVEAELDERAGERSMKAPIDLRFDKQIVDRLSSGRRVHRCLVERALADARGQAEKALG